MCVWRSCGGGGGEDEVHEMTSIAVISQHPFRSGATPTISTVPMGPGGGGGGPSAAGAGGGGGGGERGGLPVGEPPMDLDFALCSSGSEKTTWTNFHFVMCIGIVGFFVFWIVLLCRMYLPPELNLWTILQNAELTKP